MGRAAIPSDISGDRLAFTPVAAKQLWPKRKPWFAWRKPSPGPARRRSRQPRRSWRAGPPAGATPSSRRRCASRTAVHKGRVRGTGPALGLAVAQDSETWQRYLGGRSLRPLSPNAPGANHSHNRFHGPEPRKPKMIVDFIGRSGEIRTPDPLLPKQVRYQAALRSARPKCSSPAGRPAERVGI